MTRKQVKDKIKELKKEVNKFIDQESDRLLRTSTIMYADSEDSYHIPKIIITVVLHNASKCLFSPLTQAGKDDVENLKKF